MKKITLIIIMSAILVSACGKKAEKSDQKNIPQVTRDSVVVELSGRDSTSVLTLLEEKHEIVSVSSAMGTFVKAIDNVENSHFAFWLYSVNGEMSDVGADKYITSDGDTVKWHFRLMAPENKPDSTK